MELWALNLLLRGFFYLAIGMLQEENIHGYILYPTSEATFDPTVLVTIITVRPAL